VYLVAGLGNPGAKYARNRHNVGFMLLAGFAQQHGAPAPRERFQGSFTKLRAFETDLGLLAPATFMNLSGRSVQPALHFFKLGLDRLIVVHDELDLPFGEVRIKVGGGTAGHRGLASIVECCGGTGFCRIRIGIGRPVVGKVEAYVLQDFSAQEGTELPAVLERASASLTDIVVRGAQAAMNLHNRRPDSGSS
jgi:peptidyl-tRNA hydrolase, PTH1 family